MNIYILPILTMLNSFKKRHIDQETMNDVANLRDFILDFWTTNKDIIEVSSDLVEIHGKVWLALWLLSVREWWRYKQAFDKFIKIKKDNKLFNN